MSTQLFDILEITYAADYDNIEKKQVLVNRHPYL